jgi:hypothetical protein
LQTKANFLNAAKIREKTKAAWAVTGNIVPDIRVQRGRAGSGNPLGKVTGFKVEFSRNDFGEDFTIWRREDLYAFNALP